MATYIYLAVGCGFIGVVVTFAVMFACDYLGVNITENLWIIAIPIVTALVLNIVLIELYSRFKRK